MKQLSFIHDIPQIEKIGIYAIHCKTSNKYYVGSAFNVYNRLVTHERNMRLHNRLTDSSKMDSDINAYGIQDFEFLILKTFEDNEITYEQLYYYEREYAKKYNAVYPNGYNTFLPALTNSSKIGSRLKATTSYKDIATVGCYLRREQADQLKRIAEKRGTSANQILKEFILTLIEQDAEKQP